MRRPYYSEEPFIFFETVYCSKCGAEVGDDVFFCPKCGARTARGADEGIEPHWRKDLDKALQTASKSLEEVARDLGTELEQAKEGFSRTAEDVGEELRGVAKRLKVRRKTEGFHCSTCGARNAENTKFCVKCGNKIE